MESKIIICGDTHANFFALNKIIKEQNPSEVIVCGDFGVWRNHKGKFYHNSIVPRDTKVYFCDGNHEDFRVLDKLVQEHGRSQPIEISKNVFYCPRGCVHTLSDGTVTMFMGGAYSVDRMFRIRNKSYFDSEVIMDRDMENLPNKRVDMVISHTCPSFCKSMMVYPEDFYLYPQVDESCNHLSKVYDKYKPKFWYYGHWHFYDKFKFEETEFTLLDSLSYYNKGSFVIHTK